MGARGFEASINCGRFLIAVHHLHLFLFRDSRIEPYCKTEFPRFLLHSIRHRIQVLLQNGLRALIREILA